VIEMDVEYIFLVLRAAADDAKVALAYL